MRSLAVIMAARTFKNGIGKDKIIMLKVVWLVLTKCFIELGVVA